MGHAVQYDPNSIVTNKVTNFIERADEPLYIGRPNTLVNPSLAQVASEPDWHKWKVANGEVVLQTAQDQSALAAEEAAALLAGQRASAVGILNSPDGYGKLQRCIADIIKDELNILRQRDRDRSTDVAAATTLADLKTRWAARSDLTDRTLAQLETAITNRIGSGVND